MKILDIILLIILIILILYLKIKRFFFGYKKNKYLIYFELFGAFLAFIVLLSRLLLFHLKKINIEHLINYNNTDYYKLRKMMDKQKCKDINCLNKNMNIQTNKIKKKRFKKRVGCLKSKDNIKLPLYKDGKKLYYSYDDDTINYNKLKSIKKKKKRNKLANKWYKKLLKSKNTDNLQELSTMKRVKSNDCKKSLRRNINDVQIIFNKKCKTKKKKCKKYV